MLGEDKHPRGGMAGHVPEEMAEYEAVDTPEARTNRKTKKKAAKHKKCKLNKQRRGKQRPIGLLGSLGIPW